MLGIFFLPFGNSASLFEFRKLCSLDDIHEDLLMASVVGEDAIGVNAPLHKILRSVFCFSNLFILTLQRSISMLIALHFQLSLLNLKYGSTLLKIASTLCDSLNWDRVYFARANCRRVQLWSNPCAQTFKQHCQLLLCFHVSRSNCVVKPIRSPTAQTIYKIIQSCRGLVVMSCDSHSRGCGF